MNLNESGTNGAEQEVRRSRRGPVIFAVLLSAVFAALVLSACGGGGSSSSGGGTSSEEAETTTEEGSKEEVSEEGGGPSSAVGEEVAAVLGTPSGPEAGEGETIKLGAIQGLSGPSAFYGKEGVRGIELAAEQIEAAGGPKFELDAKDHKSGNTQAGINAIRELGTEGVPVEISSYSGVLGSIVPGTAQYKVLSLDPTGGASPGIQGEPYFYGFRAGPNTEPTAGFVKYIHTKYPEIKSLAYVGWEVGPEITEPSVEVYEENLKKNGITSTGSQLVEFGNQDFSDVITQLKQEDPEGIYSQIGSPEVGYFIKQMVAAGLNIPVFGYDYAPEDGEVGGSAMENYTFGFDYFQPEKPENPYAEFFVKSWEEKYGSPPSYIAAYNYETTYDIWQIVREVIAEGGDTGSGEAYLKGLEANPAFPSMLGGSSSEVGEMVIDLKTHTPSKRVQGIYTCSSSCKEITRVATFDTPEGGDFKLE